ncbi:MAG: DUF1786 domain-containing protein [Anaerolineae bacterium]
MLILAVDIGTGTQDILLFDSEREVENCFKMVLPSPTVQLAQAVREATRRGEDVVLTGVLMGGGPCAWAVRDHLNAGYHVYATPEAARTFDDDLEMVSGMGVTLISEDETLTIGDQAVHLRTGDFHYHAIAQAFLQFGVNLDRDLDALAVAVFDHGQAPPGASDRLFRFQYLAERVRAENRLSAFAFCAEDVPQVMTRMRAVAASVPRDDLPVILMDTAPAAVLGALQDVTIEQKRSLIVVNVGNFHCLAFRLGEDGIGGIFEHHTGEITATQLEGFLDRLAEGTLTHEEVFNTQGHGAIVFDKRPLSREECLWVVTGPRRNLLRASQRPKLFAAPFGDMMMSGCYGLIRACDDVMPEYSSLIERAMKGGDGRALW